jgi:hypothetical protein
VYTLVKGEQAMSESAELNRRNVDEENKERRS